MGPEPRSGAPWSKEEDAELLKGYRAGLHLNVLAAKHMRKLGGIESRLHKLDPNYKPSWVD
jgi:hypothetical protein